MAKNNAAWATNCLMRCESFAAAAVQPPAEDIDELQKVVNYFKGQKENGEQWREDAY